MLMSLKSKLNEKGMEIWAIPEIVKELARLLDSIEKERNKKFEPTKHFEVFDWIKKKIAALRDQDAIRFRLRTVLRIAENPIELSTFKRPSS